MLGPTLGLLVVALAWGSVIPAINFLLPVWDPYFLAAIRYLLGAPVFLVLLRLLEPGPLFPATLPQWRVWVLGGVGVGLFAPLFTLGVAHAHPVTAAIVSSAGPIVASVVARVCFAVPLDRSTFPAIVLALLGGTVAAWRPGEGFGLRGGEVLMLSATACWAWYSIAAQRWLMGMSQLRITGITLAPGAIILAAIYLVFGAVGLAELPPAPPRDGVDLMVLGWTTLTAVVLGIFLWNFGVRHAGVVIASLYMNLVPIVAVLILATLGTPPTGNQVVGGLMVVAGVAYVQLGPARRRRRRTARGEALRATARRADCVQSD